MAPLPPSESEKASHTPGRQPYHIVNGGTATIWLAHTPRPQGCSEKKRGRQPPRCRQPPPRAAAIKRLSATAKSRSHRDGRQPQKDCPFVLDAERRVRTAPKSWGVVRASRTRSSSCRVSTGEPLAATGRQAGWTRFCLPPPAKAAVCIEGQSGLRRLWQG